MASFKLAGVGVEGPGDTVKRLKIKQRGNCRNDRALTKDMLQRL